MTRSNTSASLKKAMAKMRHSKATWDASDIAAVCPTTNSSCDHSREKQNNRNDVWAAAKEGDAKVVREFVEIKFFDLRSHHDGSGGMTLLHYAC